MTKTYLVHHGIKGQRWGVRRYQNEDGSLTPAGKKKYAVTENGNFEIKDRYRKNNNFKGTAKLAIGTAVLSKTISKLAAAKKKRISFKTENGKKVLSGTIMGALLSTIVISSAAKSFVEANANKTLSQIEQSALEKSNE